LSLWRSGVGRLATMAKEMPAGANYTTDLFQISDFGNKSGGDCGVGGNVS
jgi:hypothetical protein